MDPVVDKVLAAMPYGLYFLSCGGPDSLQGMLVSWVSQVSGDPALLMVAVRENREMLPSLQEQGGFALNLLPADNQELLQALGRSADSRFQGVELKKGLLGLPVLAQGLGALCCSLRESLKPGDHALLLGEVAGAIWQGGGETLTVGSIGHYYLGRS